SSDWDLALTGLALPGDLRVDVAGQGTGATGTVSGSVLGTGAVPVDVEVSLSVEDAVSLSVAGSALGGTLDVEGHRASLTSGTWSGAAALSDAEYGGLDLQVVGTLYGSDLIPQALLTSSVS